MWHLALKGFFMSFLKKVTSIACILVTMTTQQIFPTFIFSGTYSAPGTLRPEMLDTHETHHTKDHFYCGVYDGHVTANAAHYIAQKLYPNIINDENLSQNPQAALFNGFIKTHEGYHGQEDGATAGVILIKDTILYAANAGDVEAVLYTFDGQKLHPNALSQDHIVEKEFDRLKTLMSDDCSLISTSPRDDGHTSVSQKQSRRPRSRSIKTHTNISRSYQGQESLQLAASPHGQSSIIQYPRIEDNLIRSSPRIKDDILKRLTVDGSIKEFLVQSVYLLKSNPDGSGSIIKPSRTLCNHHFAPYLIPDPFISRFELTNSAQCVVLASKNLWLVIEPEAVGNLISKFLIQAHQKFETDELTSEVAQYIAQKLVEKAFSIQDIGNQTVTVILFDTIQIEVDGQ